MKQDIHSIIALGEDSTHQFKADVNNVDSLTSEMAAFANSEGGIILIGVADNGATPGLSQQDVSRINQLVSNAASQHIRSPLTVQTENVKLPNIRNPILVSYIAKGMLPYKGLGSGIKRALKDWPDITFTDDREGCLFTAIIHRNESVKSQRIDLVAIETPVKTPVKTLDRVYQMLSEHPTKTLAEVAAEIGKSLSAVERACSNLVKKNRKTRK